MFPYLWVDTESKSRLTIQDRKSYGASEDYVNVPTPTPHTNALMELLACVRGWPLYFFDVTTAYPHAPEEASDVYLRPPPEWRSEVEAEGVMVWKMVLNLYGRRPGGSSFRNYFQRVLCELPNFAFKRGVTEPTAYTCAVSGAVVTHHVDDGRLLASLADGPLILKAMSRHLAMKVTAPLLAGCGAEHLGRLKIRVERGWVTRPDPRHLENAFDALGFDERPPVNRVSSPGVKRPQGTAEDKPLSPADTTRFRSATGSLVYYSTDVLPPTFAVKELARRLHAPTDRDWCDLARAGRWLWHRREHVIFNLLTEPVDESSGLEVRVDHDSDWAGSTPDRKSTSGVLISIGGFRVWHSASTQPGLPALSSAEAELRCLARAASEGLYTLNVLTEMNVPAKLVLYGDSEAALSNASKLGVGRIRHLECQTLFVKEAVRLRMLRLVKQDTKLNAANALTKHVCEEELARFGFFGFLEKTDAVEQYNMMAQAVLSTWEDITPLRGETEEADF